MHAKLHVQFAYVSTIYKYVYIYIYTYMYICIYVDVFVRVQCVYVWISGCLSLSLHDWMSVSLYVCVCWYPGVFPF